MEHVDGSWRKSTFSGSNGGGCVEVGKADRAVLIRDTRHRDGLVLRVPASAWRRFTAGVAGR
jgi:hypothetical protein